MALLGNGALAMWWDMAPEILAEFEDWHSHEHVPERLAIPGFLRASRWTSVTGGQGVFVMYEVEAHSTLSSPAYLERLNAPTPWSTKLMPRHRNMVRAQCHVRVTRGGGVGRYAQTIRFRVASPVPDMHPVLSSLLEFASCPGLTGVHLLQHEAPNIGATTEQNIRGNADQTADWILVASGYERSRLEEASETITNALCQWIPVTTAPTSGWYALSHSATPRDCQPTGSTRSEQDR